MSSRSIKAINGIFTGILGFGVQLALQVVMVPIIIRVAGQEAMGAYSIIMQIIGYGILLDFGFSAALNRFLSQAFGFDDNGKRFNDTFNIGRTFLLIINLVLGFLIFICSFFIKDFITAGPLTLQQMNICLLLLAIWIVLRTPFALYGVALNASQNMSKVNLIAITCGATRFLMSMILIYMGMGLIGMVLAYIFSEALTFFFNRKFFFKSFRNYHPKWLIADKGLFKEILAFGLRYWGVNLAVVLFYGSDSIIVGHLFGAAAASIYYITKTPSFFSYQLIFKLSDNIGPATNELYAKSEFASIQNTYIKLLKYSLLTALPLSFGIICFNKYIISIWAGANQYAGDLMTYSIAMFVVIEVINHVNAMIVVVSANMRWWTTISAMQSIMGISLSIFLGKLLGLEGIMLGFLISSVPIFIYLFYRTLQSINLNIYLLWKNIFIPTLISSIPLLVFTILIKNTNFQSAGLIQVYQIPIFLTIWVLSLYILAIDRTEKIWIISLIRSAKWLR